MTSKQKSLLSRFCAAVLALLGFASCEKFNDIRCEYGTPSVDFKVKGTVTDADEKPIEGIRVIVRTNADNLPDPRQSYVDDLGRYHVYGGDDTLYTDVKGRYESHELNSVFIASQKVYFDDVDGGKNGGAFESDSVELKTAPNRQYQKGDGHWYSGGYEYTVDVQLQKRKDIPLE